MMNTEKFLRKSNNPLRFKKDILSFVIIKKNKTKNIYLRFQMTKVNLKVVWVFPLK